MKNSERLTSGVNPNFILNLYLLFSNPRTEILNNGAISLVARFIFKYAANLRSCEVSSGYLPKSFLKKTSWISWKLASNNLLSFSVDKFSLICLIIFWYSFWVSPSSDFLISTSSSLISSNNSFFFIRCRVELARSWLFSLFSSFNFSWLEV